jgi:hypothetical protein
MGRYIAVFWHEARKYGLFGRLPAADPAGHFFAKRSKGGGKSSIGG